MADESTLGAPFQWATIFHKSDLTFTKGVRGLEFYCSSHYTKEYEVPTKVSCSYCRTPIMDEGRNVCLLFPESIEFVDNGASPDTKRSHYRLIFFEAFLHSEE